MANAKRVRVGDRTTTQVLGQYGAFSIAYHPCSDSCTVGASFTEEDKRNRHAEVGVSVFIDEISFEDLEKAYMFVVQQRQEARDREGLEEQEGKEKS